MKEKLVAELSKLKVRELRKRATSLGVHGAWDMKKADVIDAIANAVCEIKKEEAKEEAAEKNVPVPVKSEDAKSAKSDKSKYIEGVQVGTIIAFNCEELGKVISAKVINKSTKNKRLKVETQYGAVFVTPYDSVIWVKTGTRWPRGVYNLLKGIKSNE